MLVLSRRFGNGGCNLGIRNGAILLYVVPLDRTGDRPKVYTVAGKQWNKALWTGNDFPIGVTLC